MIYEVLLLILLPVLDRVAGSDARIPGKKNLRRVGIPLSIWLTQPDWERAFFCVCLGILFSFNLNEIEEEHHNPVKRDWEEIALYGFAMAFCLWTLAGRWAFIPCVWWMVGIYWSNVNAVVSQKRLDWKYVEAGRGLSIAVAIALG